MEKIDEITIKLPPQFLDITMRGICEEELDIEEKKVYLNIVKNHKEEFRMFFVDNYLYKKIFNTLIMLFGSFDIFLFMTEFHNLFMVAIVIAEIIIIKKGTKDIIDVQSYRDLDDYINTIEEQIANEISNKTYTLKKETNMSINYLQ